MADDDTNTGSDLRPDPLAAALTWGNGGHAVPFVGILADDDDHAFVRVYQDHELRTFVRIPRQSVRHRERTRNSAGLEVSMVFVDARARVEIREVNSEEFQADLLAKALLAAGSGVPSAGSVAATPTVTTITPPLTAAVCTKIFCTNITCACTARHSAICSITCSNHPLCPSPWTENWFCAGRQG